MARPLLLRPVTALALALALGGCGAADRIASIGKAPDLSPISNPQMAQGYQPVVLPMPQPRLGAPNQNSLWDPNRRSFFKDQRAGEIGDILTVTIQIDDRAQLDNETERSRDNGESLELPALFGLESLLPAFLPDEVDPANLADIETESTARGEGSVTRRESIDLQLAAIVTQVLPNGNLAIQGRQEVVVNFERRDLYIAGVIRPEDIGSDNTISYEKIAEARIAYGGKGQITDVQQPRYGQQLYDILVPF